MSAGSYYNPRPSQTHPFQYEDRPPSLPPKSTGPIAPHISTAQIQTPYSSYEQDISSTQRVPGPYSDPYKNGSTQSSLRSDTNYYGAGGDRPAEVDSYSDEIPLRTHAQKAGSDGQYASSPVAEPTAGPRSRQPRRKGFFQGKIPWVIYTLTLVQVIVFIVELVKNGKKKIGTILSTLADTYLATLTGTPIEIHLQFNPMIGPSTYVQINMGARFVACMRKTSGADPNQMWPCPNTTTTDANAASNHCSLGDLCGFGAAKLEQPHQWFRFIVPMFLHAGIIHIGFNMLLQMTMGREMELIIGSIRMAIVYFSSGIFGFVLGGNFAANGIASTGASGALFGIIALELLDLLYNWNDRQSPGRDLAFIVVDIVVSFVLGLLPGLDNFSHIGGFIMGLALGICLLHSPSQLRQRVGIDDPKYAPMDGGDGKFDMKKPVGFFKGRKPLWWAWWLIRAGALVGVLAGFIVLLNDFYQDKNTCHWCRYLSCLVSLTYSTFRFMIRLICYPADQELV